MKGLYSIGFKPFYFLQNLASCSTYYFKNTILVKFYEASVPGCRKQKLIRSSVNKTNTGNWIEEGS
jgi:hypothetical protein